MPHIKLTARRATDVPVESLILNTDQVSLVTTLSGGTLEVHLGDRVIYVSREAEACRLLEAMGVIQ